MNSSGRQLWRVFPWDADAPEGERFSPSWIPDMQGQGRFDLPGVPGGVLYLAETPEHAVAESIQHYRGQRLDSADLEIARHPLALVMFELPSDVAGALVDLCDPGILVAHGIRPDHTASGDRHVTQVIAARIHAGGHSGLRWWSALLGDWHTVALFRDRTAGDLTCGAPEPLSLSHPAVLKAMRILGIRGKARRR